MEKALFKLGNRLYEALDYIFEVFDDVANLAQVKRAIVITVTATPEELVAIENRIRAGARAFNTKYASFPGRLVAISVTRSRKPRPGVPAPNEQFTIDLVANPPFTSSKFDPIYLAYNQITPRPQLRPPPPPEDPTIPLSNTIGVSFSSFEPSQEDVPQGGDTQPMDFGEGVLEPEAPPSPGKAAKQFHYQDISDDKPATPEQFYYEDIFADEPETPAPVGRPARAPRKRKEPKEPIDIDDELAGTVAEEPGTVIEDPYINYRRTWTTYDDPSTARAATTVKLDDVVNHSDYDMLMENRIYASYVEPIITADNFEIPTEPVIGAWLNLPYLDRIYTGFIAIKCIEHFMSYDEMDEANAMVRVWLNAAFGIYYEDDLQHAPAEIEGNTLRAGMSPIECEAAMLNLLSRTATEIYKTAYEAGLQRFMLDHAADFVNAEDAAIYRRLRQTPNKLLPLPEMVDGILLQCMHESAAQFFVDLAGREAPTARDVPLRLYLLLPPDFYDVSLFDRDPDMDKLKQQLMTRIVEKLSLEEERADLHTGSYMRLLVADKMLRQNVEFSPIVQCTAPAPLYDYTTATGPVPSGPVNEYGFPMPETVKWPLLNFRYMLNNGEYAVPHSSWHNSRYARILRSQAFIRMVDMACMKIGDVGKVYEWSSQLHLHDPTNHNVSRHGIVILPKYRYRSPTSKEGETDDNETIITAVVNLSYDRTLVTKWNGPQPPPESKVGPGEMFIYERGDGRTGRLLAEKRKNRELATNMNPFMYMQCSIIVVGGGTRRPDSLVKLAVENGNILQVAGVFRSNLYRGSQAYTDRGDYVNFMYKPRSVIESPAIYPIFRDHRIMLQRAALYEWFNLPMIVAKEEVEGPQGLRWSVPYTPQPTYSDKAYKGFDTQRILLDPHAEGTSEIIRNLSEAQTPLKPADAMYTLVTGKEAFAAEMKRRNFEVKLLYPIYLPPTRSLFLMDGFNNEYDQSILRDLLNVTEYEIARMMGATRLNNAYIKRTPEAYEKIVNSLNQ